MSASFQIKLICKLWVLQGLFELAAKTYKPKQQRQQRQQQQGGKRRPSMTGTIEFLDAPPSDSAATLQLQVSGSERTPNHKSTPCTTRHDRTDSQPVSGASALLTATISPMGRRLALLLRRQTDFQPRPPTRCQTGFPPRPPPQCRCLRVAAGATAEAAAAAPATEAAVAVATAAAAASRWRQTYMGCLRRGLGAGGRGSSHLQAMKTCRIARRSGRGSCAGLGGRSTPGDTSGSCAWRAQWCCWPNM
jgi:hypothetical protein